MRFFIPCLLGILGLCLLAGTHAWADTIDVTVGDDFYGGRPVQKQSGGTLVYRSDYEVDVIGTASKFDTTSMEISYDGSSLSVDIVGGYFDNVGVYSTFLGDLFVSTDGWNPYGTGHHIQDYGSGAHQGEDWELVLAMDAGDRTSTPIGEANKKAINVYAVNESNIVWSDASTIFRDGQEVSYNAGQLDVALATGYWWIETRSGYDALHYEISGLGGLLPSTSPGLGVHWAMSCGNDTFEALAAPTVPEPGSIVLLSLGLVSAGWARRRKRRRSAA